MWNIRLSSLCVEKVGASVGWVIRSSVNLQLSSVLEDLFEESREVEKSSGGNIDGEVSVSSGSSGN